MFLSSKSVIVNKSQNEVYDFLQSDKNFETLLPKNCQKFEIIKPSAFAFQLKGMPEIVLQQKKSLPSETIIWKSAEGQFDFELEANIGMGSVSTSEVLFLFDGNFNSMLQMMAKKPIQNFINMLGKNLSELW